MLLWADMSHSLHIVARLRSINPELKRNYSPANCFLTQLDLNQQPLDACGRLLSDPAVSVSWCHVLLGRFHVQGRKLC